MSEQGDIPAHAHLAPSIDAPLIDLPGVASVDPHPSAAGPVSELETAARRTIRALAAAGVLGESHALQCQLLLDLARGYSRSIAAAGGKVTVAASATAAQVLNLLDSLPQPTGGDDDESKAWRELVARLEDARGSSALRDRSDTGRMD